MAVSRRQVALHVAQEFHEGKKPSDIAHQLAAYLFETKRTNEVELLLRDIEAILSEKYNMTFARAKSAHPLDDEQRKEISQLIKEKENATKISLEEEVDRSLIGGVVIETPSSRLDTSVVHQLQQLKALSNN